MQIKCKDKDVLNKVYDIYSDLTGQGLLERCLKGRTQNPKESLHSQLWAKCSKTKFSGYEKVLFAAQVTVLQQTFGHEEGPVLPLLGIPVSKEAQQIEERFEMRRSAPRPTERRKRNPKKGDDYASGSF